MALHAKVCFLQNCPFTRLHPGSHLIMSSWDHPSPHHKRHVDRFGCFSVGLMLNFSYCLQLGGRCARKLLFLHLEICEYFVWFRLLLHAYVWMSHVSGEWKAVHTSVVKVWSAVMSCGHHSSENLSQIKSDMALIMIDKPQPSYYLLNVIK